MTSKIYIITNDINDKVYIGKTTLPTIEDRFKRHKIDSHKETLSKRPLYNAMRKYGTEHFHIALLEECDVNIDNERESYWIEYYDSYHNGYNATMGGDGKHYLDYEKIREFVNNTDLTYEEIARQVGCCADSVKKFVANEGISKERLERMAKRRIASLPRKAIEQYYPDGSYFQSFESIADAARWIAENRDSNKKVSYAHIGEAAKDFSKVRYGYRWKFKE